MILRASVALVLILLCSAAQACRCEQRTLAEYYQAADVVILARLHAVSDVDESYRQFEFELVEQAFRGPDMTPSSRIAVRTGRSSAACGIAPETDAIYVVFATADGDGQLIMDSCSGTRIFRSAGGNTFGFEDVPDRFVVAQLQAQSGLDVLQQIAQGEPRPNDVNNENLIGLVDIAAFTHTADAIPLYASPCLSSEVVSRVGSYDDLESRESGYEVSAAIVYAELDGWHKVRLNDGKFAWLAPQSAGTFWGIAELIEKRLNYLTKDWSRMIWPDIGAGIPHRVGYEGPHPPREQAARLLKLQTIGSSLWMQIEVLSNNECEGGSQTVLAHGWTPVYTESGRPAIWYYSRGC